MSAKSTKQNESKTADLLDDVSTARPTSKKGNALQECSKTAPFHLVQRITNFCF